MTDIENSILGESRILLVDSEESVRTEMISYFKGITRLFIAAGSAEEALPALEGPSWDIIVCNLKLPGINGLEFCKRVQELNPESKLILASRHVNASLKKKAAEVGISHTISAPLSPDHLLSSLIDLVMLTESAAKPVVRKTKTGYELRTTVSIMELDESMIITAYIRFGDTYRDISAKTCAWLRHNFTGAQAIVTREGKEIEILVAELKPGDTVSKLYRLPTALMKLTFVRTQLIKDLKRKGFLAFEVKRKPTRKTLQQEIRLGAVLRTEEFIGKVSENLEVREQVSDTVKALFTSSNDDQIDVYDLINDVDSLISHKSAEAISVIAALKKGDHLYTHCIDVGAIFLTVYSHWMEVGGIISGFRSESEILLSAILHDIGKIFLPETITMSEETFDVLSPEMKQMRDHPIDGARILSNLNLPETTINMARYHHVKSDISSISSYPSVLSYEVVLTETRLLAIVDMFQSLVGRRPYKKSWAPADAMKYIDQMAGVECDPTAWVAFREALGWYPVGTLVKLNDGSQAFVVEKAYHGLYRPSVVVTRNSSNEELTHNTLIDLNTEKDIFIKQGLDHYNIYGENAIHRFIQLQVS